MGAILRAHPHEPLAAHHALGGDGTVDPEHPHRTEVMVLGMLGALAGALVLIGGVLLWFYPSTPYPWLIPPPTAGEGPTIYALGVMAGGIVLALGVALMFWPQEHAWLGPGIVVGSVLTLLAGPLLWIGF